MHLSIFACSNRCRFFSLFYLSTVVHTNSLFLYAMFFLKGVGVHRSQELPILSFLSIITVVIISLINRSRSMHVAFFLLSFLIIYFQMLFHGEILIAAHFLLKTSSFFTYFIYGILNNHSRTIARSPQLYSSLFAIHEDRYDTTVQLTFHRFSNYLLLLFLMQFIKIFRCYGYVSQ